MDKRADLTANLLLVSGGDGLAGSIASQAPAVSVSLLASDISLESALAGASEYDAAAGLSAGFDDPVAGAQSTFRSALEALSHPGSVLQLKAHAIGGGTAPGLSIAMTALLLTLVDSDAPVWLPNGISAATQRFLRFHCGCPLVDTPAKARFVAVPKGYLMPDLAECDPGDPAYPDRSTTLLIEVEAMASTPSGQAQLFELTSTKLATAAPVSHSMLRGPGIEDTQSLTVSGLPAGFWAQWRATQNHFPLGVDVFLCSDTAVCGLPRTTRVEI